MNQRMNEPNRLDIGLSKELEGVFRSKYYTQVTGGLNPLESANIEEPINWKECLIILCAKINSVWASKFPQSVSNRVALAFDIDQFMKDCETEEIRQSLTKSIVDFDKNKELYLFGSVHCDTSVNLMVLNAPLKKNLIKNNLNNNKQEQSEDEQKETWYNYFDNMYNITSELIKNYLDDDFVNNDSMLCIVKNDELFCPKMGLLLYFILRFVLDLRQKITAAHTDKLLELEKKVDNLQKTLEKIADSIQKMYNDKTVIAQQIPIQLQAINSSPHYLNLKSNLVKDVTREVMSEIIKYDSDQQTYIEKHKTLSTKK